MLNNELSRRGRAVDSGSESAFAAGAAYAAKMKASAQTDDVVEDVVKAMKSADAAAVKALSSKQMGLTISEAKELVRLARKESNETDAVAFVGVCLKVWTKR